MGGWLGYIPIPRESVFAVSFASYKRLHHVNNVHLTSLIN